MSASKQVRTRQPTISGASGGGGTVEPDIIWAEALKQRDALGLVNPKLVDTPRYRDVPKLNPVLFDTPRYRDARVSTVPSATATKAEALKTPDLLGRAYMQDMQVARSGTPDSDKTGDFWGDRALPTVAHGNENLRVQAATVPGITNDEQEAFMKWNLTTATMAGMSVRPGSNNHTLKFWAVNNDLLLAKNISVNTFHNGTTNPFTESTATYNTRPTAGTAVGATKTAAIPANTAAQITLTYTNADAAALLNRWVYWHFFSAELVTIFFTITSRDSATNRPQLSLDLYRA